MDEMVSMCPGACPRYPSGNGRNECGGGCMLKALGGAASMTMNWFTGTGPSNMTFGPGSVQVDDMDDAPGVNAARDYFYSKNAEALATGGPLQPVTDWGAKFTLWDFLTTASPTQQFVGSYRVDIYPEGQNLNFVLTNNSSFQSFAYGAGPSWERSSFGPMGVICGKPMSGRSQ
jgi:hypothetical protein